MPIFQWKNSKGRGPSRRALRPWSLATASAVALLVAQTAHAADAAAGAPETIDEVVVTGSRVTQNGYTTPTPVTVIGEAEIRAAGRANLADFVQQLPSVVGSTSPATTNAAISDGGAGINSINLRGLGNIRTLVLLDGRRTVGSTVTGTVDINTFPQGLVKSVEIVTGGASAAYGSDAVSGVANFILDKTYTGFKMTAEGGETTYGDDKNWRVSATGGMGFAGGRGHILLNGELMKSDGIYGVPRAWNNNGNYIISNPAYVAGNGKPEWIIASHAGPSTMMPGGIITNTALRGTYFGVGGSVSHLTYGDTKDPDMVGGDWQLTQVNNTESLHSSEDRSGVFGRLSYNVTDNIEAFAQLSWNRDAEVGWGGAQRNEGGITIRTDNAFLPAAVKQQARALGITQFTLGSSNGDLMGDVGNRQTDNHRTVQRYLVGFDGTFDALGADWKWDASYQVGIADTHEEVGTTNNARLALAQDAVINPANGQIVCRSTLTNPGNGCVPFNRMGVGVNSQAAIDYVLGFIYRNQRFQEDVGGINFSTRVANPWFEPIGLAFGAEHRRESVSGYVPPEDQSGWFTGNYLPNFGHFDVSEAYVEAAVPITKQIEFNGAARGTYYSTSGYVTTWKTGLTWQATEDLKFRATRSRDIRAPNLGELFSAGTKRTNTLIDPFSGNQSVQFLENTTGNAALKPEVADSLGLGVVYRPSFIPGLGLSIDYYDISINGAIGKVSAQDIVNRCFSGTTSFCGAITRGVNSNGIPVITQINNSSFNFTQVKTRGIDFEASYYAPLERFSPSLRGNVSLRGMATHYIDLITDDGVSPAVNSAGQNSAGGTPSWVYRATASYDLDSLKVSVTGRGVSAGVYSTTFVRCSTACPASTVFSRTIDSNHIDGAFYIDTNISYEIGGKYSTQVFFTVTNLLNKNPAIVAEGPGGGAHIDPSTNTGLYDFLGRTFRVGVHVAL